MQATCWRFMRIARSTIPTWQHGRSQSLFCKAADNKWAGDGTCWGDNMFAQCLIYVVFSSLVSSLSFYLVWYFWLNVNKILNTYMQFPCKCMKIDCEIDWDARGRWLRFCLGHQITQGRHWTPELNFTLWTFWVEIWKHFVGTHLVTL